MGMLRNAVASCFILLTAACATELPLVRMAGDFDFPTRGELNVERRFVVRDQAEWEEQWRRITPNLYDGAGRASQPPAPPVDFTREMILIAEMGLKGSHGFDLKIDRAVDRGSAIEAVVWHFSPGPSCAQAADNETPTDVVRIPATAKPIRWRVMRAVRNC